MSQFANVPLDNNILNAIQQPVKALLHQGKGRTYRQIKEKKKYRSMSVMQIQLCINYKGKVKFHQLIVFVKNSVMPPKHTLKDQVDSNRILTENKFHLFHSANHLWLCLQTAEAPRKKQHFQTQVALIKTQQQGLHYLLTAKSTVMGLPKATGILEMASGFHLKYFPLNSPSLT